MLLWCLLFDGVWLAWASVDDEGLNDDNGLVGLADGLQQIAWTAVRRRMTPGWWWLVTFLGA